MKKTADNAERPATSRIAPIPGAAFVVAFAGPALDCEVVAAAFTMVLVPLLPVVGIVRNEVVEFAETTEVTEVTKVAVPLGFADVADDLELCKGWTGIGVPVLWPDVLEGSCARTCPGASMPPALPPMTSMLCQLPELSLYRYLSAGE